MHCGGYSLRYRSLCGVWYAVVQFRLGNGVYWEEVSVELTARYDPRCKFQQLFLVNAISASLNVINDGW
jgi:hypothetical protein